MMKKAVRYAGLFSVFEAGPDVVFGGSISCVWLLSLTPSPPGLMTVFVVAADGVPLGGEGVHLGEDGILTPEGELPQIFRDRRFEERH